jgi:hypothetical protein
VTVGTLLTVKHVENQVNGETTHVLELYNGKCKVGFFKKECVKYRNYLDKKTVKVVELNFGEDNSCGKRKRSYDNYGFGKVIVVRERSVHI